MGDMQLGPRAAGIFRKGSAPTFGHRAASLSRHELGCDFFRSKRCSAGGQTSNTVAHFALDFERKESVGVVITDTELS